VDITLILEAALLVLIVGASLEYIRRIRKAQREYLRAREAIEDIVVSFDKQFSRGSEQTERLAYKVEGLSSKSERALKTAEDVDKKMQNVDAKVGSFTETVGKEVAKIGDVDQRLRDLEASQDTAAKNLETLREQVKQWSITPETSVEAVIPIRRDKALAPLTETELSVLEMLASEGSKTAPEIKPRVQLSREHTARLMKKLYEGGYLERDTGKIPFKYSVKKEMESLLKKEKESKVT